MRRLQEQKQRKGRGRWREEGSDYRSKSIFSFPSGSPFCSDCLIANVVLMMMVTVIATATTKIRVNI